MSFQACKLIQTNVKQIKQVHVHTGWQGNIEIQAIIQNYIEIFLQKQLPTSR